MEQEITIRAETPSDVAEIRELVRRAFGREPEAQLVDAIRDSPEFIAPLSLVAEEDGRIVGHVLFSRISIETADGPVPALVLAPAAVLPECQNRGVGSKLIRAGLDQARALGERIVVLVGHRDYYPRFGFSSAREQGLESPFPVDDPYFMALDLVSGRVAGVRGMVRYPPAFDLVE